MRYIGLIGMVIVVVLSGCSGPEKAVQGEKITYNVSGINCINCAVRLRESLMKLDGIKEVEVSIKTQQVAVFYEPSRLNKSLISKTTEEAGFKITNEGG